MTPSGTQLELQRAEHRAVIVEVGAGLRSYAVDGEAVVEGYAAGEMCSGGRGQLLMPWPNRLRDGRYTFEGITQQLPLSEPAKHNAIHGLVRWAPWRIEERAPHHAVLTHRLFPQPGFPGLLDLRVSYHLDDAGLTVELRATNAGTVRCPFGAGAHPYLTVGEPSVDTAQLTVPAEVLIAADDRGLPLQRAGVEGTPFDFRQPRRLADLKLDHTFTGLHRDPDGRARVTLSGSRRKVTLWAGPGFDYLQLFSGDSLAPGHRRKGLAVEPMTCAPDAFNSGDGLWVLEPGQSFSAAWGIEVGG